MRKFYSSASGKAGMNEYGVTSVDVSLWKVAARGHSGACETQPGHCTVIVGNRPARFRARAEVVGPVSIIHPIVSGGAGARAEAHPGLYIPTCMMLALGIGRRYVKPVYNKRQETSQPSHDRML